MSRHTEALDRQGSTLPPSSAIHAVALAVTLLALSACSRPPPESTAPAMTPAVPATAPSAVGAGDTSVPSAASVPSTATVSTTDPAVGRSNSAMSKAQESAAMPMPGQNNDHSAPVTPSKRASGP